MRPAVMRCWSAVGAVGLRVEGARGESARKAVVRRNRKVPTCRFACARNVVRIIEGSELWLPTGIGRPWRGGRHRRGERSDVMARFGVGRTVGYRRLRALVDHGLVTRSRLLYGQPALYVATREGLAWAGMAQVDPAR